MVYTTRLQCLECGNGYNVYDGRGRRSSSGCGKCDFITKLRSQYGSGEHADRWIYLNEGEDAHDRLLKLESERDKHRAQYELKLKEVIKKVKEQEQCLID